MGLAKEYQPPATVHRVRRFDDRVLKRCPSTHDRGAVRAKEAQRLLLGTERVSAVGGGARHRNADFFHHLFTHTHRKNTSWHHPQACARCGKLAALLLELYCINVQPN